MIGLGLELAREGGRHQRGLSPWQGAPAAFAATTLYDFDAGLQAWTKSGTNGTVALDTAVKDAGMSQSLRIATASTALTADAWVQALSPNLDLSGKAIRLRYRFDQVPRLGYFRLALENEAGANYTQADTMTSVSAVTDSGEWVTSELTKSDFSSQATDFSSIDRVRLRLSSVSPASNVLQANFQSIALRPLPARGCVVLAFDDGWKGQYLNAFPLMAARGLPGSCYVICDLHGASGGSLYMNRSELHALQSAGWDIGCHADTASHHSSANGFADTDLATFEAACVAMKRWQIDFGFNSDHFAWPRGIHTRAHRAVAARYFSSQRTFRNQLNGFEADIYPFADATRLRQCAVTNGSSPSAPSAVNALIDSCMAAKKTLILTFHDVGNGGGASEYPTASFAAIVDHIAAAGHPVKRLTEVFASGV